MSAYKAPGVYVKEVSLLPASVAAVDTAIPAFLGYTEKATKNGVDITGVPTRITSMKEYEEYFGGANANEKYYVTLDSDNKVDTIEVATDVTLALDGSDLETFHTYKALQMYFENGGGDCYIVSVGLYSDVEGGSSMSAADFTDATLWNNMEKADEPTLLLAPDAVNLGAVDLGTVQQTLLAHAAEMQDRFAILDVQETTDGLTDDRDDFRTYVGMNNLSYGAAYIPNVHSLLKSTPIYENLVVDDNPYSTFADAHEAAAKIDSLEADVDTFSEADDTGITRGYWETAYNSVSNTGDYVEMDALVSEMIELARVIILATPSNAEYLDFHDSVVEGQVGGPYGALGTWARQLEDLIEAINAQLGTFGLNFITTKFDGDSDFTAYGSYPVADDNFDFTGLNNEAAVYGGAKPLLDSYMEKLLLIADSYFAAAENLKSAYHGTLMAEDPVYAGIINALLKHGRPLPPSGAVAGRYVSTDNARGVWKAPANVSVTGLAKLSRAISKSQQGDLNIDATTGKSINAIRKFTGRGNIIYGARTLAGNDAEWRFVPVRRLFIMVEESIQKASEFVVFEPNDANTWQKVKGMVQNFLTGLWRDGALAGSKPEEAFFVNVGLGTSMTQQDILEGRLIIEVGLAAVRPAEFVILKFSHKLQES